MKILITGGAGYIGGTVTQLLLDRGHTVVVYDNLCHAQRAMVPAGATFVERDPRELPARTVACGGLTAKVPRPTLFR